MNNRISTKNLNILKAALPFFPVAMQKNLSYFVKINEFQNMYDNLSRSLDSGIAACEVNGAGQTPFSLSDLLFAIKPYLDPAEAERINNFSQMMQMIRLYRSLGTDPSALFGSLYGMGMGKEQASETTNAVQKEYNSFDPADVLESLLAAQNKSDKS